MPITEKQIQFNAQQEASRKVLQKMKEAPLFVDTSVRQMWCNPSSRRTTLFKTLASSTPLTQGPLLSTVSRNLLVHGLTMGLPLLVRKLHEGRVVYLICSLLYPHYQAHGKHLVNIIEWINQSNGWQNSVSTKVPDSTTIKLVSLYLGTYFFSLLPFPTPTQEDHLPNFHFL